MPRPNTEHAVWIKVPLCDAEVYRWCRTRRDAERIAPALAKRAAARGWGSDLGRCEVWIESPGSLERALHRLHDSYETE